MPASPLPEAAAVSSPLPHRQFSPHPTSISRQSLGNPFHSRKARSAFLAVACSLGLLTACTAPADDSAHSSQNTTTGTADSTFKPAESSATRTISHAMGSTELGEEITTVAALDRTVLDPAIALGLHVVGFTELQGDSGIPAYFGDDGEKYAGDAVSVGELSDPSLEKVAALKPDAILSSKVRHEDLYERMSSIAPTVFSDSGGHGWKDSLRLVGEVADKSEKADELITDYEERAARIGDRVREKLGKNPSVTSVRFVDGPTRIYKDDSYIGVIFADLGFARNDASTGTGFSTEISAEEIAKADADYIFTSAYGDNDGEAAKTQEEFQRNPLWNQLKGEIHDVDDTIWMSAVGIYGANEVLDDIAEYFEVDAD